MNKLTLDDLRKMIEQNPSKYDVIFSPADHKALEGVPNAVASQFLEPGTAYAIERKAFVPKPEPFPSDLAFEDLNRRFAEQIYQSFMVPARYWGYEVREPDWHRQRGESLMAWARRLERAGLLDNPEKRWEYQKAVLSAAVSPVRIIVSRLVELVVRHRDQ